MLGRLSNKYSRSDFGVVAWLCRGVSKGAATERRDYTTTIYDIPARRSCSKKLIDGLIVFLAYLNCLCRARQA